MEEKKNDNKVLIIVLAILGGFAILGMSIFFAIFLLWGSIQKSINNQWNEMVNEQKEQWNENINDDEEPIEEVKFEKTIDGKAVIYFFRGEGCSHCAEAEAWFKSIEDQYGKMFMVKDYETWYDSDNAELMKKVSKSRKDNANGVPYIIIGDKSWIGFTESYEDEMLSEIKKIAK